MSELHLRLFGAPVVTLDGRPVVLRRRASVALLAYLAVTGRPHRREALVELLAGDPVADAGKLLTNALVDLRAALGARLADDRRTVALTPRLLCRTDVAAFRAGLEAGLATDDVAAIRAAIGLYADDFLAGFALHNAPAFEEWTRLEQEELHAQLADGLQALMEHHIRQGEVTAGIAAARRLLGLEPWHEEALRALMGLLAGAGQRRLALLHYERGRRALAADLGIEPTPGTAALARRLRAEAAPPLPVAEAELALQAHGA